MRKKRYSLIEISEIWQKQKKSILGEIPSIMKRTKKQSVKVYAIQSENSNEAYNYQTMHTAKQHSVKVSLIHEDVYIEEY